jgi:hypothetical protein
MKIQAFFRNSFKITRENVGDEGEKNPIKQIPLFPLQKKGGFLSIFQGVSVNLGL